MVLRGLLVGGCGEAIWKAATRFHLLVAGALPLMVVGVYSCFRVDGTTSSVRILLCTVSCLQIMSL